MEPVMRTILVILQLGKYSVDWLIVILIEENSTVIVLLTENDAYFYFKNFKLKYSCNSNNKLAKFKIK